MIGAVQKNFLIIKFHLVAIIKKDHSRELHGLFPSIHHALKRLNAARNLPEKICRFQETNSLSTTQKRTRTSSQCEKNGERYMLSKIIKKKMTLGNTYLAMRSCYGPPPAG